MNCRFCDHQLEYVFADLNKTPLANSYLTKEKLDEIEIEFPLKASVCEKCFLVQVDEFEKPQNIFSDYAYFSSFSSSWLNHVKSFTEEMVDKFELSENDQVVEIASNDGYLLKNFQMKKIPVLGVEPAENVAKNATDAGIPTIAKFFGLEVANEIIESGEKANLLIAFNVLPHVPNLKDFIAGMKKILSNNGVVVIQFSAYLLDVIQKCEFDMIYHEHFSYFSLTTLKKIFDSFSLDIFDVKEISVHGGSLRLFLKQKNNQKIPINESVAKLLEKEKQLGLLQLSTYTNFQDKINDSKMKIKKFFVDAKQNGSKVVCYGAAAKGNTVLNFCKINSEFIEYVVDISPHKQGKFLPGTHIPIFPPEKIKETKPDYIVILAWNLKDEIIKQIDFVKDWNCKFVFLIPEVEILK